MKRSLAAASGGAQVADSTDGGPRSALEATTEAFAVGELVRDTTGAVIDLRWLAMNRAFEALTGLSRHGVAGRRARDLMPDLDPAWWLAGARAVATGVPQRLEAAGPARDRRLQLTALDWGPECFGLLLDDPQAGGPAEARLRASAQRQSFLVRLADAVRPLTDARALQQEAARLLGLHLAASRVVWWDLDGDEAVRQAAWSDGVAPPPERLNLSAFGQGLLAAYRAGELADVADAAVDPRIDGDARRAYRAAAIAAVAGLMLMRQGRWVAVFEVHQASARCWQRDELDLIRDVADRVWTAAQRARAETALRENEACQQFLLLVSDALSAARDPRQLQTVAARLLGERLRAQRVAYLVVEGDEVVIEADHVAGVGSLVGRHPRHAPGVAGFGLAAADVEVVDDLGRRRGLRAEDRAVLQRAGIAAYIAAPLNLGAHAHGVLVVHAARPREWTTAEISLVREVAERSGPAVDRARAERSLAEAQASLREFAARQEAERDAERHRLALDVHDELGQQLTALKLQLGGLQARLGRGGMLDRAATARAVGEMQNLLDTTIEVTRDLAARLRPPGESLGLASGASGLAEDFALRTELACEVRCTVDGQAWAARAAPCMAVGAETDAERIDAAITGEPVGALLRILQESLTNVARHAGARRVAIELRLGAAGLEMAISDDGCGFDLGRVPAGRIGLLGMRERAARIGATIDWNRRAPCGTIVRVRWPWAAMEPR